MSHRDDLRNIEDVLDEGQDGSECMICGRTKANHHDFERRQRGCVCEAGGWEGADFVEFICRTFIASQFDPERCATCEHDKACHTPRTEVGDGEVLASRRLDAACACGHLLRDHQSPGTECYAVVGNDTVGSVFCACNRFVTEGK